MSKAQFIVAGGMRILHAFVDELSDIGFKPPMPIVIPGEGGAVTFSERSKEIHIVTLQSIKESDLFLEDDWRKAIQLAKDCMKLQEDDAIRFAGYAAKFDIAAETVSFGCQTFDRNQIVGVKRALKRGDLTVERLNELLSILNETKRAPRQQGSEYDRY